MADVGPWSQEQGDGGLIRTFNNRANLTTTPQAPIQLDESGNFFSGYFWTGTSGGGIIARTCNDWINSSGFSGTFGRTDTTTTTWTAGSSDATCTNLMSLL